MVCLIGIGLIETLWSHLKAQFLHVLEDMVVALEHDDVLVADGVVAFLVVHIHESRDLWERVGNMLHEVESALLVAILVVVELHYHHPLARVGVADDNIAKQAVLLPQVKERERVLKGIVADGVADAVVQVVHQPAFLNGQNLVESTRDMESDAVHVVILESRSHLFACEPALVAASELQFVAVFPCLLRTHDGRNLGQFHLAYASQLVIHLLLLGLQLLGVGEVLPLATTAHSEMLAKRSRAYLTILYKADDLRLTIAVLLLLNL